jgi:hypothetical protein
LSLLEDYQRDHWSSSPKIVFCEETFYSDLRHQDNVCEE